MKNKTNVAMAGLLGWPGKMSARDKGICYMSLMYSPYGDVVLQIAEPLAVERREAKGFAPPKGVKMVANFRIDFLQKNKAYGWFMDEKDGQEIVVPWQEDYFGHNVKLPKTEDGQVYIPPEIVQRAHGVLEDWIELGGKFLPGHLKEETHSLDYRRMKTYIMSLGRAYAINKGGAAVKKIDRRSYEQESSRPDDEALAQEDG